MEQLREAVKKFVDELGNKNEFAHLSMSIEITEGDKAAKEDVALISNAMLTLKNSILAANRIYAFTKEKKIAYKINTKVVLKMEFARKEVKSEVKQEKATVQEPSLFEAKEPDYCMEDIVLPDAVYNDIQNALSIISFQDLIYNQWGYNRVEPHGAKSILCFYGKPGTGKTMCAHAIAKQMQKKIINASYADIQSEYVGRGAKNLKQIFATAEAEQAVLFFDEADAFLRKRTSDTANSAAMHYNSMTNEMMKHLEEFNGIVIFATNLTENIDEAFKTRLTCSIEIPLPNLEARAKIIKSKIPSLVPMKKKMDENDYKALSEIAEGFSGRDIRNAIKLILSDGARLKQYPFDVDHFVNGFTKYKQNKQGLDENITGTSTKVVDTIDLLTENGSIIALLTYAAWLNGKETDEATEKLKDFSKLLNRKKPIINKQNDLPKLEEMCEALNHDESKTKAILYLCELLALSSQDKQNRDFIEKIMGMLKMESIAKTAIEYYEQEKSIQQTKQKIAEYNK